MIYDPRPAGERYRRGSSPRRENGIAGLGAPHPDMRDGFYGASPRRGNDFAGLGAPHPDMREGIYAGFHPAP